ncbi:MAG: family 16 glycosylhydrolase [Bacteroidia bacterium]|nr:family 16 glycosylhydrolase [Bacteroidia bacterium]
MGKKIPLFIAAILQIIILNACKKESVTPDITFTSSAFTVVEDNPLASVSIPVKLSGISDEAVSVDYITEDSTALAGKDYTAITAGKLTFQPGEILKTIEVSILLDTAQKRDVYFRIILSNPVNAVLTATGATIKIINVDYTSLVWSDEFNTASLNTGTWNYELGAGGWGNNELQTYTNSVNNVHIDTGYLHITALNPSWTYYTSGRITTQGKKEFTWGRINIRAKLPEGQGIWPALWMLGGNFSSAGWPKCGEIDIMELLGKAPSVVYGTVHWDANGYVSRSKSYTLSGSSFSTGFHVFSLVWTSNNFKWLVDGKEFFNLSRSEISAFPFDLPQFFIFNLAVGGNWPGSPDQTTHFPQHMIVDYIRVYQ